RCPILRVIIRLQVACGQMVTICRLSHTGDFSRPTLVEQGQPSRGTGWTPRVQEVSVEGGDAGLGRDAYGLPRRQRGRRAHGPDGPADRAYGVEGFEVDDGFEGAEEADPDGRGYPRPGPGPEEDEYGQLLRRPGDMAPRYPRLRQPGRPRMRPPGSAPPP